MARVGSTFLNLGMWLRGEKPGAGSQYADNNALNGNTQKIDKSLGTQHNVDGTHKSNVITGTNLASSVADGASLLYDTVNHYIKVNALGILTSMINDLAVTGAKIAAATISAGKFVAGAIATADIADSAITTVKVADLGVTGAKIAHDCTKAKVWIPFALNLIPGTAAFFDCASQNMDTTVEIPMLRAGCITGYSMCQSDGSVVSNANVWASSGDKKFAANDRIAVRYVKTPQVIRLVKNGVDVTSIGDVTVTVGGKTFVIVEVELD